jgi:C4-type Zn-finger protein
MLGGNMNRDIMVKAGFGLQVAAVEAGHCPSCGAKLNLAEFRDSPSYSEYLQSGLCQKCQDRFFDPLFELEMEAA